MKSLYIALSVAALAAPAAHAQGVDRLLEHNAAEQTRIAADVARARIDTRHAAQLEQRAAGVYRDEAQKLAVPQPDRSALMQVKRDENGLAHAITYDVKHRARHAGTALDRMHLTVAARRDAEQQRWIARGFRQDRLTPAQVGALEDAQARIARAESDAARSGRETIAQAETVQHMQNVQDYAILKDPSFAQPGRLVVL